MWVLLSFLSAFLLGCYDICKKKSLDENAVIPVLFLNTLISTLIFTPFIILSYTTNLLDESLFYVPRVSPETHGLIALKSLIVLSSWITGYFSVKNLPLTITGPIKATQPVITLTGAMLIFGERLNLCQWTGVLLAVLSFYMLSASGKKEGIRFSHDKWIFYAVLSIIMGAVSGLYDKFLMKSFDVMTVQVWFNVYQFFIMIPVFLLLWYPGRKQTTPYHWKWSILLVSLFLAVADWVYFYALGFPDAMISVVSMIRRSSVLVTFVAGAVLFHEKNLKNKAIDLFLVLLGMIFLYLGTK
ncbi:MAG TPA: EamA family transporter [Porphyromonadaceae bacterium]|nr:EamA family transporter [Porphyromonadaceae bacterium]